MLLFRCQPWLGRAFPPDFVPCDCTDKRLGYPNITVHGMRSAFRDWAGETTAFASDVCEAALAHIKGKTERAYQRGDLFNKRRRVMDAWAEYCASLPSKTTADVVPIRK